MAYVATNPPVLMVSRIGEGPALWIYNSEDVHTDVDADGYFTNGDALGMQVGDMVLVGKTTATIGATVHYVSAVAEGGAATVAPAILA